MKRTGLIQAHLKLTPEEQKRELDALCEKAKALSEEQEANTKNIEKVKAQLERAQANLEVIKRDRSKCHERRQLAIAFDKDPSEITTELKRLRDDEDLLEDTLVGLGSRLRDLESESGILRDEKNETEWLLQFFEIIPSIIAYNHLAEKTGEVLSTLYPLLWTTEESQKFIVSSLHDWGEGLWLIPRLSFAGDDLEMSKHHHFDGRELKQQFINQAQRRLRELHKVEI